MNKGKREFWLLRGQLRKHNFKPIEDNNEWDSEVIHVIEYSAYQELQRENGRLKELVDIAHKAIKGSLICRDLKVSKRSFFYQGFKDKDDEKNLIYVSDLLKEALAKGESE